MANTTKLKEPWLIAVWPGMGHVALSAGYYLLAKLGMHLLSELPASDLFDVDQVEVKLGRVQPPQRPRSRFFVWQANEMGQRDLVVFIGEAQPPLGKYRFCESLIDYARDLGVQQVFTFAAMATQMHPEHKSRVFAAATEIVPLSQLQQAGKDVTLLSEGMIGGLNGVLLGAAAEKGMPGVCLLGEMPHVFSHLPFPKASLAVLRVFIQLAKIQLDFVELEQQAQEVERRLGQFLARLEKQISSQEQTEVNDEPSSSVPEQQRLDPEDERHIEELFITASQDRSRAYELKSELDRLGVFAEYENRFLDLFKKTDEP
jgi:uncharacterized protein